MGQSLYRVDALKVSTSIGENVSAGGSTAQEGEVEELERGRRGHCLGQVLGVVVDKVSTLDRAGHGCLTR